MRKAGEQEVRSCLGLGFFRVRFADTQHVVPNQSFECLVHWLPNIEV